MPLADSECHQTVSEDVMNSFEEGYRHSISMIPNPLKPDSTHHGKHSYTKSLGIQIFQFMSRCSLSLQHL